MFSTHDFRLIRRLGKKSHENMPTKLVGFNGNLQLVESKKSHLFLKSKQ